MSRIICHSTPAAPGVLYYTIRDRVSVREMGSHLGFFSPGDYIPRALRRVPAPGPPEPILARLEMLYPSSHFASGAAVDAFDNIYPELIGIGVDIDIEREDEPPFESNDGPSELNGGPSRKRKYEEGPGDVTRPATPVPAPVPMPTPRPRSRWAATPVSIDGFRSRYISYPSSPTTFPDNASLVPTSTASASSSRGPFKPDSPSSSSLRSPVSLVPRIVGQVKVKDRKGKAKASEWDDTDDEGEEVGWDARGNDPDRDEIRELRREEELWREEGKREAGRFQGWRWEPQPGRGEGPTQRFAPVYDVDDDDDLYS